MSIESVCVYASSSDKVDDKYRMAATRLGTALAVADRTLVYGGARIGLMGAAARAAKTAGGTVVGVIPEHIAEHGLAFDGADEMIITGTMRERKQTMEDRADAFVALPGGFGTLEEILEIITLKQLHRHEKAICLFDVDGFYQPLVALFEHLYRESFANDEYRAVYHVSDSVEGIVEYLDAYTPAVLGDKWH